MRQSERRKLKWLVQPVSRRSTDGVVEYVDSGLPVRVSYRAAAAEDAAVFGMLTSVSNITELLNGRALDSAGAVIADACAAEEEDVFVVYTSANYMDDGAFLGYCRVSEI
jgi:hypothetical protein